MDLGCGDGKLTKVLAELVGDENSREWTGIDPDHEETTLAQHAGLYEKVHTCFGNSIPEQNNSFDFVFSNSVLEHIPEIGPVIEEVSRILRPQGRFIFTVPSSSFHSCLGGPLIGSINSGYLQNIDARCAHTRYWGRNEWEECLERHNLTITAHEEYLDQHQTRRWEFLSNMTGGLLYKLLRKQKRPIEIQRKLRMRKTTGGITGRIVSQAYNLALMGANPDSIRRDIPQSCILIDAIKR